VFSLSIPKGPVANAVETLQVQLDLAKQDRLNVVLNLPANAAVQVPELRLRNVSGPDALMLIATAAGCELKPIVSAVNKVPYGGDEIIGWEIRAQPVKTRIASVPVATNPLKGSGPYSEPTPTYAPVAGMPATPSQLGMPGASAPTAGRSSSSHRGEVGIDPNTGAQRSVPFLSEVPVLGDLFVTPAPPNSDPGGLGALGGGMVTVTPMSNARSTRVYALGTLTSYTKFPDVAKTLDGVIESDGIPPAEVKVSFHDKTNVLVVNGTERAHALIGQLIQALTQDVRVRDAQNNTDQLRDLKGEIDQTRREVDMREAQIQELRKRMQEMEEMRLKAEMELKLLKGEPKPR
jgi:hypothetical protein